jgi:hypothetical protein
VNVFHVERCPKNPKLQAFVAWWQIHGPFPIVITSGRRTDAEQWELYQQGRMRPGKIVTHAASAANSAHGHDGAIDCSPVRDIFPGGGVKTIYVGDEEDGFVRAQAAARLDEYVRLVKQHGLQSGVDFPGLHDLPHAEDPEWHTLPYPPP